MSMLPPQLPPDSQESIHSSSSTTTSSHTSFPPNAYGSEEAWKSKVEEYTTPPSSAGQPESQLEETFTQCVSESPNHIHQHRSYVSSDPRTTTSSASSPVSGISGSPPTQGSKRTASGVIKMQDGRVVDGGVANGYAGDGRVVNGHVAKGNNHVVNGHRHVLNGNVVNGDGINGDMASNGHLVNGHAVSTTNDRPEQGRGRKLFHTRTQSTDTMTSSVSELSAQLRARLSYAMSKVQNGRLSQTTSPSSISMTSPMSLSSTMTTPRGATTASMYATGRNMNANVNGHGHVDATRQSLTLSRVMRDPTSAPVLASGPGSGSITGNADTYTSWTAYPSNNSHSGGNRPSESYERGQPLLAPPVDFKLPNNTKRNGYHTASGALSTSNNPPAGGRSRTPTKQEQEAVDTLIFMSSPKNSARYSHSHSHSHSHSASAQQSPLRSEFIRSADYKNTDHARIKRRSLGNYSSSGTGTLRTGRDVDVLLESMVDEERGFDLESNGHINVNVNEDLEMEMEMEAQRVGVVGR